MGVPTGSSFANRSRFDSPMKPARVGSQSTALTSPRSLAPVLISASVVQRGSLPQPSPIRDVSESFRRTLSADLPRSVLVARRAATISQPAAPKDFRLLASSSSGARRSGTPTSEPQRRTRARTSSTEQRRVIAVVSRSSPFQRIQGGLCYRRLRSSLGVSRGTECFKIRLNETAAATDVPPGDRAYSPAIVSPCRRARFRRWLHNQGDVARTDRHSGRRADFLDELRDQGALPLSRSLPLPPTQDRERHPRRESRSLRSAIRRWSFASSRRRRPAPVLLRRSCDVRRRPRRSRRLRSAV